MTDNFTFSLVTPEKELAETEAYMAIIPGSEGEFGVLPGHAPMIVQLGRGVVRIHDEQETLIARYFISGGFAEVQPQRATILAQRAYNFADYSSGDIQTAINDVEVDLKKASTQTEIDYINALIADLKAFMDAR